MTRRSERVQSLLWVSRLVLLRGLCAWLLWLPAVALGEAADLSPEPGRFALGGELGYHAAEQTASTLHLATTELSLHYALSPRWSLAADLSLATVSSNPEQGDAEILLRFGNPTVLGYLRPHPELALGGGFAVPAARVSEDSDTARLERAAYNFAAGMKGLSRVWLWAANRAAVVTTAQWRRQLHPEVEAELQAWPSVLWRAVPGEGGHAVDLFIPSALSLWVTRGALRPGLALSAAWLLTNDVDKLQLAIEPQLRLQLPRAFVELRYLHSLDEPLAGPRGAGVWGLHLAGGSQL